MNRFKVWSGFTLVEIVVVVAILGILAIIRVPQFKAMKNQATTGKGGPTTGTADKSLLVINGELMVTGENFFTATPDSSGLASKFKVGHVYRLKSFGSKSDKSRWYCFESVQNSDELVCLTE